ncbi:hypothetical protein WDW89_17535 [Deltaproteobacteria bacterium TL4]
MPNILGVNKATNETSASAREVNQSAVGLAKISGQLQTYIGQFKVNELA